MYRVPTDKSMMSWLCSPVLVCVLFLFNVIDYSRFLKSVFSVWTSNLASCSLSCTLYSIKKRTSVCKNRGCHQGSFLCGCWKPVTIVVGVFCTALYHESVNTVMSNLFITTDYWTRAQKCGSSYMWICWWRREAETVTEVTHGMCHYLAKVTPSFSCKSLLADLA